MLVIFWGLVLVTLNLGGIFQYILPAIGAAVIMAQLKDVSHFNKGFVITMIQTIILLVFQIACVAFYAMWGENIANFASITEVVKTAITTILLVSLYGGIKEQFKNSGIKENVSALLALAAMNIFNAAVTVLTPILNFNYDILSSATVAMVYMFIFIFVFIAIRLIPVEAKGGNSYKVRTQKN